LSAWTAELARAFPHLSGPQVGVLAQYSMGMVLAGRCGLSCVAYAVARWLGQTFGAARERLRDWYLSAADKSGTARRELDVGSCYGPLLAWVLCDWEGPDLAVALDATTPGERFVVLEAAVLYRGGAVPVAWSVLPAAATGSWKPHWLRLLRSLGEALGRLPASRRPARVVVLADRGPYARWLFRAVAALGWHPLLRVNSYNAEFRPDGGGYVPVASLAAGEGDSYAAAGVIFRNPDHRQTCTLLARRDAGHEDAWHLVTDLPPGPAQAAWYALRPWVERGFRHAKGGGLHWDDTRMTDPARAARQRLAMAVASVLLLRQGGRQDQEQRQQQQQQRRTRRILSAFCMGMLLVRIAALTGAPAPRARFAPEPWPSDRPRTTAPPRRLPPPQPTRRKKTYTRKEGARGRVRSPLPSAPPRERVRVRGSVGGRCAPLRSSTPNAPPHPCPLPRRGEGGSGAAQRRGAQFARSSVNARRGTSAATIAPRPHIARIRPQESTPMAKKKSDDGATKKQATETKKAAAPKERAAPAPKATTKAAASTTKAASADKASAAGSAATKKKAPAKPAATSAGGSVPLIDTSLAAETAAKFVVNRALLGNAATAPAPEAADEEQAGDKRESSTFKQLKAGLNKPASQGLGGILGTPNQGKKGNFGPGGGSQQVGRNQTFGADVNRSGVPRRTGG
jgi:hypothetical protein